MRGRPEGIISTEEAMSMFNKNGLIFNAEQTDDILDLMDLRFF